MFFGEGVFFVFCFFYLESGDNNVCFRLLQKFNGTEIMFLKEKYREFADNKLNEIFLLIDFIFLLFCLTVEVIMVTNKLYSLHHENE